MTVLSVPLVKDQRRSAAPFESSADGSPGGWIPGARNRVIRGGGYDNGAANARSANRNANSPENRDNDTGLRVANASLRQIARVERPARRAPDAQIRLPRRDSTGRRGPSPAGVVGR